MCGCLENKPQEREEEEEEPGGEHVPAVDSYIGVRWGQAVGHVALHAFKLGLPGGVVDGAGEGVRILLPLGPVLPHHHTDTVSILHKSSCLPEQEGLAPGLDEGGEPVEVPPHRGRALGLLLLLGAPTPGGQGGGHRVQGGRAAETLRCLCRRGAVVPVVVPVVIAALAGWEAAPTTANAAGLEAPLGLGVSGREGGLGGWQGFGEASLSMAPRTLFSWRATFRPFSRTDDASHLGEIYIIF